MTLVKYFTHHPTDTGVVASLATSWAWVPALEQWETGLGLLAMALAVVVGVVRAIIVLIELKRTLEFKVEVKSKNETAG